MGADPCQAFAQDQWGNKPTSAHPVRPRKARQALTSCQNQKRSESTFAIFRFSMRILSRPFPSLTIQV